MSKESTTTETRERPAARTPNRREELRAELGRRRITRRRRRLAWIIGLAMALAIIVYGLATSRPTQSRGGAAAPDFTLTDTSGTRVHLADFRGRNVLLYFSEGAGCQPCMTQLVQIENDKQAFNGLNVAVLPIVMNSRDSILADMRANNITTPFLLDDGTVSREYGTLGKGMHSNLPGHGFVLVGANGRQRWYGEYPSMWISPGDLLTQIRSHLS